MIFKSMRGLLSFDLEALPQGVGLKKVLPKEKLMALERHVERWGERPKWMTADGEIWPAYLANVSMPGILKLQMLGSLFICFYSSKERELDDICFSRVWGTWLTKLSYKNRLTHASSVSDLQRFVFFRKSEVKDISKIIKTHLFIYNQEIEVHGVQMNFLEP